MASAASVIRRFFGGGNPPATNFETLYPKSYDDIKQILKQAKDNLTPVKVTGGTYPLTPISSDVVVDLRYINRLIGLDIYKHTVVVESGMKLSQLGKILETVSLSLDLCGRVPDLTICDAISVGTFGANAVLMSSLCCVEVLLSDGKIRTWTWEKDPEEMKTLCCGLGMAAVILSVTIKCVPLQRYTEISYLCSIRDIMEQWNMQFKSSFSQQLTWFPFSELIVMTHLSPTEKYQSYSKQPWISSFIEKVVYSCSQVVRRLSILASWHNLPFLSSILSRVQFVSQWSVAKYRSDFVHHPIRYWSPGEACRGTNWLIPAEMLPKVLYHISLWTHAYSDACVSVSPLFIQSFKMEKFMGNNKPYLGPFLDVPSVSVWYDWFLPSLEPDPIAIAEFEDIFHSVGAKRTWSGERLTSPLVLNQSFRKYNRWCRSKLRLDSENLLSSAYINGMVFSGTLSDNCSSSASSVIL